MKPTLEDPLGLANQLEDPIYRRAKESARRAAMAFWEKKNPLGQGR